MTAGPGPTPGPPQLRQVILATDRLEQDVTTLRAADGLPTPFADPEVEALGWADRLLPVGPTRYLEPVGPGPVPTAIDTWIGRRGGQGGYCLSVEVSDLRPIRERTRERGARIGVDQVNLGHRIMQLHPYDVGVLLDLGEHPPGHWFWDEVTPGPAPGARIVEVTDVHVAVEDPAATAALWGHLLGAAQPGPTSVDLGATVHFGTGGRGLVGATVRMAPGLTADPDRTVAGILVRHQAAPGPGQQEHT